MPEYAPVAVFAYRRPSHLRRLLVSLFANPEARASEVYVFADGARSSADAPLVEQTRTVARAFEGVRLIERDRNLGLANNVMDGVSSLCRSQGRVVALEDDLAVSNTFLKYMNAALARYSEVPDVFHVSAYTYPVKLPAKYDAVFLPFINSTGWGTWKRAWDTFDAEARGYGPLARDAALRSRFDLHDSYGFFEMLEAQVHGRVNSWAIRWYLTMFMRSGLALFPTRSLVEHHGFGEGATHTSSEFAGREFRAKANPFDVQRFPPPRLDTRALRRIERFLRWPRTIPGRAVGKLRRVLHRWST